MTEVIQYRPLQAYEIDRALFAHFQRHQTVTRCWRKLNGKWCIQDITFIDDWTEQDYATLIACLKNTVQTGGFALAAFVKGQLKGFCSVEAKRLGRACNYADLSSLHVSEDMRRHGIGNRLFEAAKQWAKAQGASKLYISAHSAVESQAFYHAMGCVEAIEYNRAHVEQEPCDCQLECPL